MAKGAAASDKAGAQEVVIHLFLVGDHRVPCPCHPVAHGVDAAAHKARKTVGGVVDGLAHGDGVQLRAVGRRGHPAPADGFDSFHSTSQYGRPSHVLNREEAGFAIICNFCYQTEILVEYSTICLFCQVFPDFLALFPAFSLRGAVCRAMMEKKEVRRFEGAA